MVAIEWRRNGGKHLALVHRGERRQEPERRVRPDETRVCRAGNRRHDVRVQNGSARGHDPSGTRRTAVVDRLPAAPARPAPIHAITATPVPAARQS
jgi:hypothetical protein